MSIKPNYIVFSKQYVKLPMQLPFRAVLLQALHCNGSELSEAMLDYDVVATDGSRYPSNLLQGELIMLILKRDDKIFTTIRTYTDDKFKYFKSLEGKEVHCIMREFKAS